jgi:hypothetical protein
MGRFLTQFLAARPDGNISADSVRDALSITLYPETVEGPLIRVSLGETHSEQEYLWDGSDDDADAIIDACAAYLAAHAKDDR